MRAQTATGRAGTGTGAETAAPAGAGRRTGSGPGAGRGLPGREGRGGRTALAALVGLWVVAGALAVRQAAAVLRQPPDERLSDLLAWTGADGVLRVKGSLYDGPDPFTGSPFAGLVLRPLTRAASEGLGLAWTSGTLLLVAAVAAVAVRALPEPLPRRARLYAMPAAFGLLMLSMPVRNTFHLGQTSILPVLLLLVGWLATGRPRAAGLLIGLGAGLQPAAALFVPVLWLAGRRRAAVTAGGTFAAVTALAWGLLPGDSWAYWVHHLAGTGLGGPAVAVANQSLHGALLRAGLHGPLEIVLLAALAAAVCWLAVRRAVRYAGDGQALLAAAVTGCAVVAVSPTAWQHQQLWILLAAVGRVGRRSADRLVWPLFVVVVMSLDRNALVPNVPVLSVFSENTPLVAALLAACLLPFLRRSSPFWAHPVPATAGGRPHLLLELLLIRVGYFAYSWVRGHAPDARSTAQRNGADVLGAERFLHLDPEHWLNRLTARHWWLEHPADFFYEVFHFMWPIALLVWLYARRPGAYRRHRRALSVATLLGLVGFWLYPLAPPRLMPGLGYVDTAHGPQDLAHPDYGPLTQLSNQYAAMPSLHVGWALWCAVVVVGLTGRTWLRVLGVLYPILTTVVVMATANHYLLDAAGGVAVVLVGYWAARFRPGRLRERWRRRRAAAGGTRAAPAADDAGAARRADGSAEQAGERTPLREGGGPEAERRAGTERETDAAAGAEAEAGAAPDPDAGSGRARPERARERGTVRKRAGRPAARARRGAGREAPGTAGDPERDSAGLSRTPSAPPPGKRDSPGRPD